jgi:hypothetical protein
MAKNRGADMQPEFDARASEAAVSYSSPRTGGQLQDELRAAGRRSGRQTLGDPQDYSNAASDRTANTPVKPRSRPPLL